MAIAPISVGDTDARTKMNTAFTELATAQTDIVAATDIATDAATRVPQFDSAVLGGPWGPLMFAIVDDDDNAALAVKGNGATAAHHLLATTASGGAFRDLQTFRARSTTSLTLGSVFVEATTRAGLPLTRGMRVQFASKSDGSSFEMIVERYQGGHICGWADTINGSGTYTDWIITPVPVSAPTFGGLPRTAKSNTSHIDDNGIAWLMGASGWIRLSNGPVLDPLGVYVSASAINGLPAGNDGTGGVGPAIPFATLAAAITFASGGAKIYLNGSPASPTTYNVASAVALTKSLSFESVVPFGATISRSANVKIFDLLSGATGIVLTFGQLELNGAGYASDMIALADTAAIVSIGFNGTRARNWLGRALAGTGTATKCLLVTTNIDFQTTGAAGAIYLKALTAGGVDGINGLVQVTGHTDATQAVVEILHVSTTPTFQWINPRIIGLVATAAGTDTHEALSLRNVRNWRLYGGKIEVRSTVATTRNGAAFVVTTDSVTALDSSGGLCVGTEFISGVDGGGYVVKVGEESPDTVASGNLNGIVFRNFIARGVGLAASAGGLHGLFAGSDADVLFEQFWVENTGYGLAAKSTDGALFRRGVVIDSYNSSIAIKGTTDTTFARITALNRVGTGQFWQAGTNDAVLPNRDTLSTVIEDCSFYTTVASSLAVNWFTAQAVTPRRNNYYATNGWGANRFAKEVGGTPVYASSAAAWIAATETTSFSVDPMFADIAALDLRPAEPSKIVNKATGTTGGAFDFNGNPTQTPGCIGAFEMV